MADMPMWGGEHGVTNEIQGKKSLRPGETLCHEDAHGMLSEPLHVGERLRVLEYGDVQARVFFRKIFPGGFRPNCAGVPARGARRQA